MRTKHVLILALSVADVSCMFERPADVKGPATIGGAVTGMWPGASIVMRLQSSDTNQDELLTVDENGSFTFSHHLDQTSAYVVSVERAPSHHACVVDGASGLVSEEALAVTVRCTGPAVDIRLMTPSTWTFDPSLDEQTVPVSLLVQQARLVVTAANASAIAVATQPVASGVPSPPVALSATAPTPIDVSIAIGDLTRVYRLNVVAGAVPISQATYGKASNVGRGDGFGPVAIGDDYMIVGAGGEDSDAAGIDGDPNNDRSLNSGAAYVFVADRGSWRQTTYLKAANAAAGSGFGSAVAATSNFAAVGAVLESTAATGINHTGTSGAAPASGAVYVFSRNGQTWTQEAYIKASNAGAGDYFGLTIAASGDTLVVGAPFEDSSGIGINPAQLDEATSDSGAVYVFRRTGTSWAQEALIKPPVAGLSVSGFGNSVAIDGDSLVIGADGVGHAYVYTRTGASWHYDYMLSPPIPVGPFGSAVAISGSLIVAGVDEDSTDATGINGTITNQGALDSSGAAFIYEYRNGEGWTVDAYVTSRHPSAGDQFGRTVAISGDVVCVDATFESSAATGIDGDDTNRDAPDSGASFVFRRINNVWSQIAYVKASNTGSDDNLGACVVSRQAMALAAPLEDSGTGQETDNSALSAGAFYAFR